MNNSKTNESNNELLKSSIIDIVISFVSASFIFIGGLIISFLEGYKDIFPNSLLILCISLSTIILLLIYAYLRKSFNENAKKAIYRIISLGCLLLITLFVVHFIFISKHIVVCLTEETSANIIYENYKYLTLILVIFLHSLIIYYPIKIDYQSININHRQNDYSEENDKLLQSFDNISKETNTQIIRRINDLDDSLTSGAKDTFEDFEACVVAESHKTSKEIIDSFNCIVKKISTTSIAITSTTIPVKIDGDRVRFYLVTNTSYPEYTWMFPGGHINLEESDSPDAIAVSKAQSEANLTVEILDIYKSFDLGLGEAIDNMIVFPPPHYLTRFELAENAKCYRKMGHKYHLDLVYVSKITKFHPVQGPSKRIFIELPLVPNNMNIDSLIEEECNKALTSYYSSNRIHSSRRKFLDKYVLKMLSFAYKDIIKHNS